MATTTGVGTATTSITSYDSLGRVTADSHTIVRSQLPGPNNYPTQSYGFVYTWNLADSLKTEQYPSGRKITTAYSGANRPTSVTGLFGTVTTNYVQSAQYAAFGGSTQWSWGNALTESKAFNGRLQTKSHSTGSLLNLSYAYNDPYNNGNLTNLTQTAPVGTVQSFGYDQRNRLAYATDSAGGFTQKYDYDQYGNRYVSFNNANQFQLDPATPTSASAYNTSNNRYVDNPNSPTYDAAGNRTVQNPYNLSYDGENRIGQATLQGNSNSLVIYQYDGDGRRVSRLWQQPNSQGAVQQRVIFYAYDALGELVAEYTDDPTRAAIGTQYRTADYLDSTRLLTDNNGTAVSLYEYLPFGERLARASGTPSFTMLFTGKERDPDLGLDWFQSRYYAANFGRFTSPDAPLEDQHSADPQSWNLYSYARNNPLTFVDPSGNDCVYVNSTGGLQGINQDATSRQCGDTGGYWVNGTVTDARFAHGSLILTGTTNGNDRTSASYGLGPDAGLLALQRGTRLAEPGVNLAAAGTVVVTGGVFAGMVYGALAGDVVTLSIEEIVLDNRAAGDIIRWGKSQSPAGVSQTRSLTQKLTKAAVNKMKQSGLNRATVEKLINTYEQASATAARSGIRNDQLAPRLELMKKILSLW